MADDVGLVKQSRAGGRSFAAFISYSHRDEEFGDWLHKRLEGYQVPSALVGRETSVGPIGKRLGKVFRDRADLSAAHDLGREIREGLEQSDALIVLCSPRSCGSKYVQEEIRTFKQMGKGQRIFAAIIDGEPHAAGRPGYTAADECFPPSLIYRLAPDGSLSSQLEPTEPIAADFREGKDGRENGALKIIAGLLDVGLDELVQRERQAERRRRLRANAIATAMAVLALGAASAGAYAWFQRNDAVVARGVAQQKQAAAERAEDARAVEAEQRLIAQRHAETAQHDAEVSAQEATASAWQTRTTLHGLFARRAWEEFSRERYYTSAMYDLAGMQLAVEYGEAENIPLLRAPLAAVMHRAMAMDNVTTPPRSLAAESVIAAFSPDSQRIATADAQGIAYILNVANGALIATLRTGQDFEEAIYAIAFSPDGSRVVTAGSEGFVRVWDARDGSLLFDLDGHEREVRSVVFSSNGRRFVTAGADHSVRIWSVADGQLVAALAHDDEVGSAYFSADGQRIFSTSGQFAYVWSVSAQRVIRRFGGERTGFASFSPDGSRLFTWNFGGDGEVWETSTGRRVAALAIEIQSPYRFGAVFSRDNARVATRAESGNATVWNARTGQLIAAIRPSGSPSDTFDADSMAFSTDGGLLLVRGEEVTVWGADDGRLIAEFSVAGVNLERAAFSPDETRLVSTGRTDAHAAGPATVWDTRFVTASWNSLANSWCAYYTSDFRLNHRRLFLPDQVDEDPILAATWTRDRDVCARVPGVPAMAEAEAAARRSFDDALARARAQ